MLRHTLSRSESTPGVGVLDLSASGVGPIKIKQPDIVVFVDEKNGRSDVTVQDASFVGTTNGIHKRITETT